MNAAEIVISEVDRNQVAWFPNSFENALIGRLKRRIPMRMFKLEQERSGALP